MPIGLPGFLEKISIISSVGGCYTEGVRGWMPDKRMILWAVALVVAFGVGFAIGAALWEEDVVPAGWSSEPAGFVSNR